MRLSTLFALTALAAVTVEGACYRRHEDKKWKSIPNGKQVALDFVDSICDSNNSSGVAGYFDIGQTKYACLATPSAGIKFEFKVTLWEGRVKSPQTISDEECKYRLKKEIKGCKTGGRTRVHDWWFK